MPSNRERVADGGRRAAGEARAERPPSALALESMMRLSRTRSYVSCSDRVPRKVTIWIRPGSACCARAATTGCF